MLTARVISFNALSNLDGKVLFVDKDIESEFCVFLVNLTEIGRARDWT